MSLRKLTNQAISQVQPSNKETYIWDTELRGFGVRVYPSGSKSYVVRTWLANSHRPQRLQSIGNVNVISLSDARALAKATIREAHHEPALAEAARTITFEMLNARYIRDYARLRKRSWKADERRSENYLLPAFGKMQIDKISKADIAAFHSTLGATYPYQANRCKEQLSVMFQFAINWELLPETFINPTSKVKDFPEEKKKRWLKPAEVERLSMALSHEKNPYVVAFVYLALLTSLRKNELLNLRWKNIFDNCAEIIDRKNDEPLVVPLPKEAMLILRLLPRTNDNDFVFCGSAPGKSICDMKSQWNRIRKRAGLEDVRIHDLRHTVSAWLAQSGKNHSVIGKVLGQKSLEATSRYVHLSDEDSRRALSEHATSISAHFVGISGLFEQCQVFEFR